MTQQSTLQPFDLEPSRVGIRTYVTRRRLPRIDAATVLAVMIGLLLIIPARFIVPGMPDVGRPALILCLFMFAWWLLVRLTSNHLVMVGRQPLRWIFLVFMIAMLASYAAGQLRGLTSAERNGADNFLLFLATFVGCALMVADGVANWRRLYVVIDALIIFGSIVAAIALIQYTTQFDPTQFINIPGLVAKKPPPNYEARGDALRVAATTSHYIELSTVLGTIVPFAIHRAMFAPTTKSKLRFAFAALLLVAGVQATVSRTGILALLVVLVILVPVWTWRVRYNILTVLIGFTAAFSVVDTGLIKSLTSLFDDPANNPAFTVRQERYPLVWHYFYQRPWLGRGTGTYVTPPYQILDNYWLELLISNGIVGVAALGAVHLTAIGMAWLGIRRSQSAEAKHLCAAALSTQVIALVVAGTYDSLTFLSYATILAVTIGICGALWRLTHPARLVRTSTPRWFADRDFGRR